MKLNKEQILQLTTEQQKALATLEIRRVNQRQRLLQEAAQHREPNFSAFLFYVVTFGTSGFLFADVFFDKNHQFFPFVVSIPIILGGCLFGLIQSHAKLIHRRMDALLQLVEETNKTNEPEV